MPLRERIVDAGQELYKAVDYLREQVRVFVEHQENQGNRELIDERLKSAQITKARCRTASGRAEALEASDYQSNGDSMYASHEPLSCEFEVSCSELGFLVELAESRGMDGGIVGSRMTGGGFGGYTVNLVQTNKMNAGRKFLNQACKTRTGTEPTLFSSRPPEATQVLEQ